MAGELTEDAEIETTAHIRSCEICSNYINNIATDKDALLFRTPPATFAYRIENLTSISESRTRQGESRLWKGAAAAITATMVSLLIFLSLPKNQPATTRWRGSTPAIEIYLNRNGQTQTINELKPIAGDRLRYKITLPPGRQAYAALIGIEGTSAFPMLPGRVDSEPFMISGESLLPGSVEIEPGNQSTVLVLIVRQQRFTVEGLIREIRDASKVSVDDFKVAGIVHRLRTTPGLP
jgi:hypothetical protein